MQRSAPSAANPSAAASRTLTRQERRQEARQLRQERLQLRTPQGQQVQQNAQSRQATQSQSRIDRLQQRVQRLQAQNPRSARERRAVQRELTRDQRLLAREQRTQQRLGIAAGAGAGAAAATATQQRQAANPNNAALRNAARGRFAARFLNNPSASPAMVAQRQAAVQARRNGWGPREAWRRGFRAAFIPWAGPVFWPYAYSDIFDYTFFPAAYDDGYFAYAYDDFVDTVFWGPDSQYVEDYAYADAPIGSGGIPRETTGSRPPRDRAPVSEQTVRALCGDPDKGITAWPFADIEKAVQPTPEQRALLDEMKRAAAQAAAAFKDTCGGTYSMTPPGRLQAMMNRVGATLEAVRIVKPPLEKFYDSLSDEQRARFNEVGPDVAKNAKPVDRAPANQEDANAQANACREPKPGLTNLPIERIEAVVKPAGAQKDALDRLASATDKAVDMLQAACPDDVPQTPPGRLDAMEKRLDAMLQAAKTVQQPLADFYAKLSSEQKARFNTMGQTASR